MKKQFKYYVNQFINNKYENKNDAKIALQNLEALAMDYNDKTHLIQIELTKARQYYKEYLSTI